MALSPRTPWRPDRSWADPLIAALALLAALLILAGAQARAKGRARTPERASQGARIQDLLSGVQTGGSLPGLPGRKDRTPRDLPWDRALASIRMAEAGKLEEARTLALDGPEPSGPGGPHFRPAWRRAYLGEGPSLAPPTPLFKALGEGWGAGMLRIRLAERDGQSVATLRDTLQRRTLLRVAGLAAVGIGGILAALGGFVFALFLWVGPKRADTSCPTDVRMSGRALLLLLLLWFLGSQLAAFPALLLMRFLPGARPLALPVQYLLHAGWGALLFAWAEGLSLRDLFRRHFPSPALPPLLWGLGFFTTAVAAVLSVSLALGPFLPKDTHPQKELMELMAGAWGLLPIALLFFTVAGLAPLFEELLFRGAVLGWLRTNLAPRLSHRWTCGLALALSGLAFGAIHLQPLALPVLATLGLVLGWAALRTRSLWASVLVHALWNGSVFCITRLVG